MEDDDASRVRYEKILANPGFLRCLRPECEHAEAVRASWAYDHAWNKHRTNNVFITAPQKDQPGETQ